MTRARVILGACRQAIDSAGAPLCYVHAEPDGPPVYVIVTAERFGTLLAAAEDDPVWMDHGHVEPDDDLPYG